MISRSWLVSGGAGAVLLCSCEMPRPQGAYTPQPLKSATSDASTKEVNPFQDAAPVDIVSDPGAGAGGMAGGGGTGEMTGSGTGGMPTDPLTVLETSLSGDYWMRIDSYTGANTSAGTVDTHTTTFSLVKIGLGKSDGKFKMFDFQCVDSFAQTCSSPCSTASTTVPAGDAKAYLYAQRVITLDANTGAWSTSASPYAVGWKWDYATQGDHALPIRDTDPLVYDPAPGSGLGVNVDISVNAGGIKQSCEIRVVQKIDLLYSGTLDNKKFAKGSVKDNGSDQEILDNGCSSSNTKARETMGSTLRLVPAPKPIDANWTCPGESDFRAALASP